MKITEKNYLRISGKNHEITTTDNTTKKAYNYDTVLTMKVFKKDFHVSSFVKTPTKDKVKYAKRGSIQKITFRSMKRLRFFLRNTAYKMEYEIGLTYPKNYSNDGELVKKHFHLLRSRLNYHGYKYIWILEFQIRGAPHFHMLINKPLEKEKLAKWWYKIVNSGDLKHLENGVHVDTIRNKDGMSVYFASYLSKQDQKHVPEAYINVGRFWGASKNLLDCTIKKFYGPYSDIQDLKREIRPMRRWYDAQKRKWSKKKKFINPLKKIKTIPTSRGISLKVMNSDLFVDELRKRHLDISLYEE